MSHRGMFGSGMARVQVAWPSRVPAGEGRRGSPRTAEDAGTVARAASARPGDRPARGLVSGRRRAMTLLLSAASACASGGTGASDTASGFVDSVASAPAPSAASDAPTPTTNSGSGLDDVLPGSDGVPGVSRPLPASPPPMPVDARMGDEVVNADGGVGVSDGDGVNDTPDATELATFDPTRFSDPPSDFGPGIQWVWPGGSVTDAELERQVTLFADVGYRKLAVQAWRAGITAEQVAADPRIYTVGDESYFRHLKVVARAARERGLGFDLTLGSGWPNGGVGVPRAAMEQQMSYQRTTVTGPGPIELTAPPPQQPTVSSAYSGDFGGVPLLGPFDPMAALEAVVVAPLGPDGAFGNAVDLTSELADGRLHWDAPQGDHAVLWLYRSATSHIVIGTALAGEPTASRVVDHLGPQGAAWLIEHQIAPWLDALGEDAPDHLFIDSFEMVGDLPWSPDLADRYRALTGHAPYEDMPYFFRAGGETKYVEILRQDSPPALSAQDPLIAERLREDYEHIRAEAFREAFLEPVAAAIEARGVGLRLQAHGGWGVVLDDYAVATVPEAEGIFGGGSFDFITLAASAAHVAGTREVSMESFTTLNIVTAPEVFDENALWTLLGLAYTAGINRPLHSWYTYPYETVDGPWRPNDPNPDTPGGYTLDIRPAAASFSFLSALNRAQERIGYALSRGQPHQDIAWLKVDREYRDRAQLALGSIGTFGPESPMSVTLRAASLTYDRVSPTALAESEPEASTVRVGAARYRALLVDAGHVIEPEVLERMQALATANVPIVWLGPEPARAPGAYDASARDGRVAAAWTAIRPQVRVISDASEVPAVLRALGVAPEVEAAGVLGTVGILQREVENGRVVWLFNESPVAQSVQLRVRTGATSALWLNPITGEATPRPMMASADGQVVMVDLPGVRGGILFLQ